MAGNGVEHTSSSDDGGAGDSLTEPQGVIGTAGLLAHERDGLAVDLRRHDAVLRRPRAYARGPLETRALSRRVREHVYANLDHEPGRLVRPLRDAAAAAPFLYRAPRSLSAERRSAGDFYSEGELMWLDVDAELGAISGGTTSLDGFCKRSFGIENTPPEVNPYTYEQFLAALHTYAPYDWEGYFKAHAFSVAPHPPNPFEKLGRQLVCTDAPNSVEMQRSKRFHGFGAAYSLGVIGDEKDTLSDVHTGSPAALAGLGAGDTIAAVNAREFSADVLEEELKAGKKSGGAFVLIVKRESFFRTVTVDYHDGPKYPHLVRLDGVPDKLAAILEPHRADAPRP